jgi:hypothetical protein
VLTPFEAGLASFPSHVKLSVLRPAALDRAA